MGFCYFVELILWEDDRSQYSYTVDRYHAIASYSCSYTFQGEVELEVEGVFAAPHGCTFIARRFAEIT